MRKHIDKLARNKYTNYIPRGNAIFAWTTFEYASHYGLNNYIEPAIVEFDIDGKAWCVENFISEDLYTEYNANMSDSIILNIIENYREWTGQRNEDIDVWVQESNISNISGVYDADGNPLEL